MKDILIGEEALRLRIGQDPCPHFAEAKLLTAAHAYQRETDWHKRVPQAYE